MNTTMTSGQLATTLNLQAQKGVTSETYQPLLETGLQADLYEAAVEGKLKEVDRSAFREFLGLEWLLKLVGKVTILATTTHFRSRDFFKLKKDGGIFFFIEKNFQDWFFAGTGKIEDPTAEHILRYHKLRQVSVDGPVITELGGEAKAETTLASIASLIEKQKNGEAGILLMNSSANIFYVRDLTGVLRTVQVLYSGNGWYAIGHLVGHTDKWLVTSLVFSCDSVSSEQMVA